MESENSYAIRYPRGRPKKLCKPNRGKVSHLLDCRLVRVIASLLQTVLAYLHNVSQRHWTCVPGLCDLVPRLKFSSSENTAWSVVNRIANLKQKKGTGAQPMIRAVVFTQFTVLVAVKYCPSPVFYLLFFSGLFS